MTNEETDERLKHDMDAHILVGGFGVNATETGCEKCASADNPDELFRNLSWTHPICTEDWVQLHHKVDDDGNLLIRTPTKVKLDEFDPKMCAYCGRLTSAGIFVREDPAKVLFPAMKDDSVEPTYETYEEGEQ